MTEEILAEKIAAKLRHGILRGEFQPGSSIKERDNAKELGVSRTPMREAIRILAKEGLLVLRHARSPIVANPTFKEVADAIDVLLALEKLATRLACRNASAEDVDNIRKIHAEICDQYDALDPVDLFDLDMTFHLAIVESSGNNSLLVTYKSYLERLWRVRFLSARQRRNRTRVVKQHTALFEAIANRDEVAATQALDDHLGRLVDDVRPIIEEEHKQTGHAN